MLLCCIALGVSWSDYFMFFHVEVSQWVRVSLVVSLTRPNPQLVVLN